MIHWAGGIPKMSSRLNEIIYDAYGKLAVIGDRVKILCAYDAEFYDKSGVVTLIDHLNTASTASYIFVQMANGGGKWWYSGNVAYVE